MEAMLGRSWPERDLWVCAVDLDRGRRTVFGAPGAPPIDPARAVAASCAVPSYFVPVAAGGRRYVDGGVQSPANTDVLDPVVSGLSAVVVSVPMGIGAWPGRTGVDLPGRLTNHLAARSGLAAARAAGLPILVVEPGPDELGVMHYDAFDTSRLGEVARRARRATLQRLGERRADAAVLAGLIAAPTAG